MPGAKNLQLLYKAMPSSLSQPHFRQVIILQENPLSIENKLLLLLLQNHHYPLGCENSDKRTCMNKHCLFLKKWSSLRTHRSLMCPPLSFCHSVQVQKSWANMRLHLTQCIWLAHPSLPPIMCFVFSLHQHAGCRAALQTTNYIYIIEESTALKHAKSHQTFVYGNHHLSCQVSLDKLIHRLIVRISQAWSFLLTTFNSKEANETQLKALKGYKQRVFCGLKRRTGSPTCMGPRVDQRYDFVCELQLQPWAMEHIFWGSRWRLQETAQSYGCVILPLESTGQNVGLRDPQNHYSSKGYEILCGHPYIWWA